MKEIYLGLIEQKWTLSQIDEMDFFYYFDLLIYKANKEEQQRYVTIDQVF
jgi:hypothetical protein